MIVPTHRSSRARFAAGALVAGAAAFGTPLVGQAETLLRMSLAVPATEPSAQEVTKFARLAEQKSKGSLKIEVYYTAALANEADSLTGLQSGTIDFTLLVSAFLASRFQHVAVLGLPFIFPNHASMWKVLDGEVGRGLSAETADKGIMVLAWGAYGVRELYLRDKPVAKPEDMKGLRFRVIESPVSVSMMRALGVIPVPTDLSELYVAFQQKAIDGNDGTVPTLLAMNLDNVCKFISVTDHNLNSAPFTMSKKKFDSLAPDQQKAILDAAKEFLPGWRRVLDTSTDIALQEFAKRGGSVQQVDKTAFRKAMAPVYDEYRPKIGAEYVDRVIKLASS